MARCVMVIANEAGTGKSVVSLGLVDQLERHGARTAYFKPIGMSQAEATADADVRFVNGILGRSADARSAIGMSSGEVTRGIQQGRYDEVMDRILEAYGKVAEKAEVVLCEGVDSLRAFPTLDSDINIDLARNLSASVLLVVNGHDTRADAIASNIALASAKLRERGADLAGVIVNRAEPRRQEEIADTVRRELKALSLPLYGVLPDLPALARPRVRDIVRALGARVLLGEEMLDAQVSETLVAAMGLENALHYISEGSLVITPGDREEILLAAAAAFGCPEVARPAGVLLTGGFEPRRKVLQLVHGLCKGRLPVLSVDAHTYDTAIAVNATQPVLEEDQEDKALAIRAAMEDYVDLESFLGRKLDPDKIVVTPRRFLRDLRDKARAHKKTIVLPEGNVDRIIKATEVLRRRDVVDVVLLGDVDEIGKLADHLGVSFDSGVTLVDPRRDPMLDDYVDTLVELRKHKGLPRPTAHDLMTDRTYFGTMMVYKGRADGMVSGSTTTTQATLRPAFEFVKTRPGIENVSSVFFMCLPDKVLVYGDCAVIPNPTAEQLAEIALASAETAAAFGIEPRVAMLSYSTGESGKGHDVELVRRATELAKARNPNLLLEGPIQYDAAVDPAVARTKLPESQVAGRATVFIFPDLNTGNNTYKAVQRSADAIAIGPVLQGLAKPVNDLSRGATITDVVNTVIVTAIQAASS
ncbi:MAG: phosphate acetyltransferase [Deltaproteobacteria bacterium]|nr:phosphate acetyltransferase [Deltaproteobacteria bacterium]